MKTIFWIVGIFVVICLLIVGIVMFNNRKTDSTKENTAQISNTSTGSTRSPSTSDDTLTLTNFGLAKIAPYNAATKTSGDVAIDSNALREFSTHGLKGFYVFGDTLSGNRRNPTFEFSSVSPGAKVIAASDGVIAHIKQQPETGDYEVFLQPKENSIWTIGYDHLTNVSVKQGDIVKAGDPLGEPSQQNNGLLRFELQINKDINGTTTHVCPSTLLAPSVKDTLLADLTAMQNAWESMSGKELYDVSKQNTIGCLNDTLTLEQAEGR